LYGFTDTVWKIREAGADAYLSAQRNVFGGAATIYAITYSTDASGTTFNYIKFYDGLTAYGGTTALIEPTLIIPISGAAPVVTMSFPDGIAFSTGVTVRVTASRATIGEVAPVGNVFLAVTAR
jgi:hypothetical protein